MADVMTCQVFVRKEERLSKPKVWDHEHSPSRGSCYSFLSSVLDFFLKKELHPSELSKQDRRSSLTTYRQQLCPTSLLQIGHVFLFCFSLSFFVCLSDRPLFVFLPNFYIHLVVELPNRLTTNRLMVTRDKQNHQCNLELSKLSNVESKDYGKLNTINFSTHLVLILQRGTKSLC